MRKWFKELDDVLRGKKADPKLLIKGTEHIQLAPLVSVSLLLGVVYGIFMGLYAVLTRTPPCFQQLAASAVKVPALFFLTIVVTFPSLYVFSALLGVQLGLKDALRVIVAPIAVNLTVLASLGPITGFFTLNTRSYHFMKLLNFFFFAVAGFIGLRILLQMLSRLETAQGGGPARGKGSGEQATSSSPPPEMTRARKTFRIWLILYALVGAQMGWILRPFIGAPHLPFSLFRAREANIFIDVLRTIGRIFGG